MEIKGEQYEMKDEKRVILDRLEEQYNAFEKEYAELEDRWKNDFVGTGDEHAYSGYDDALKKEEYPEWYENEQRRKELLKKKEIYVSGIKKAAIELNKQVLEDIAKQEEKQVSCQNKIEKFTKEVEELEAKVNEMQSQGADKEDIDDVISVLESKKERLQHYTELLKDLKQEIETIKKQHKELVDRLKKEYDLDLDKTEQSMDEKDEQENDTIVETEEAPKDNEEVEKEDEEKENVVPNKQKRTYGAPVYVTQDRNENVEEKADNNKEEKSDGNKEEKTELKSEEEEKELKEKFDSIYKKAKAGKELSDEEFADLTDVMKDSKKYDKFGITTGVVFNKSKVLLTAMLNKSFDASKLFAEAEKFGVGIENTNSKNNYIGTKEFKKKGIKLLAKDPDRQLAIVKNLENILAFDKSKMDEETAKEFEKMQAEAATKLERVKKTVDAINVSNKVAQDRRKERGLFSTKAQPRQLNSAPEEVVTEEHTEEVQVETAIEKTLHDGVYPLEEVRYEDAPASSEQSVSKDSKEDLIGGVK